MMFYKEVLQLPTSAKKKSHPLFRSYIDSFKLPFDNLKESQSLIICHCSLYSTQYFPKSWYAIKEPYHIQIRSLGENTTFRLNLQGAAFQRREPEIPEVKLLQSAGEGWQTAL